VECEPHERTVVIASERLNENPKDWTRVAPNHVLTVTSDLSVNVELMDIMRPDLVHV
jgi:predicted glutamine amidotransferase